MELALEHQRQRLEPPPPPTLSDLLNRFGRTTMSDGSVHTVSDYEACFYYSGISPHHPPLLYRTGSKKYPFIQPEGSQVCHLSKTVGGVSNTPLYAIWDNVRPGVLDLIRAYNIRCTSIGLVRFTTQHDDSYEVDILGPVVIWIGVHPGSTTADMAHDVSESILGILKSHEIEDVEVEWRESVVRRMA